MTVTEAARLMKMHPATIRRWIQRGWLEAVRLPNRRYMVPESALWMLQMEKLMVAELRKSWGVETE